MKQHKGQKRNKKYQNVKSRIDQGGFNKKKVDPTVIDSKRMDDNSRDTDEGSVGGEEGLPMISAKPYQMAKPMGKKRVM